MTTQQLAATGAAAQGLGENAALAYLGAQAAGMRIIEDAAVLAGLPEGMADGMAGDATAAALVDELVALHAVYFGPTSNSRRQQACRASAMSLEGIRLVETFAARLKKAHHAWKLRAYLLQLPNPSPAEIARRARAFLRTHNPRKLPQPGVRVTRRPQGPHSFTITGEDSFIADISKSITDLESAREVIFGSGSASETVRISHVVLNAGELEAISRGRGQDLVLRATDGSTMTGAEFVEKTLKEMGYVTIATREAGPLEVYRAARFANDKQRMAARALYPACAWPGCNIPAELSQYHHVMAFLDGGPTNSDNLVPLCPSHNGANNDHPGRPTRRGRIVGRAGSLRFRYPSGVEVPIPSTLDNRALPDWEDPPD